MKKIEVDFVKNQYRSGIKSYSEFTKDVGLWASEKYVFQKYLTKSNQILDLGCGTGRTTFPLNELGYAKIIGVDLTPEMISEAEKLNTHFDTTIDFRVGDALNLEFDDSYFDVVIFSFNGLMSIPSQSKRDQAIKEVNRVLLGGGIFIFTTHDREQEVCFADFWKKEFERWEAGEQNPKLYGFGDLLTESKNELSEIYIHIPNQAEILRWLLKNNFELIETFYRSDKFNESEKVKSKSGECRFWVTRKKVEKDR